MGEAYWDWREQQFAHPGRRAVGGEPCVICDDPVPSNAHWKHRDRHVCPAACNRKLSRRFTQRREREGLVAPVDVDPYIARPPMVSSTDTAEAFPYGFLGLSPRDGDIVVLHGSTTVFEHVTFGPDALAQLQAQADAATDPQEAQWWSRRATRTMACIHAESGSVLITHIDDNSTLGRRVDALVVG